MVKQTHTSHQPIFAGYGTSLQAGSRLTVYGRRFCPYRCDVNLWTNVVFPEPAIPSIMRHTGCCRCVTPVASDGPSCGTCSLEDMICKQKHD